MIRSFRKVYPVYFVIDLMFFALIFFFSYLFRYNSFIDIFTRIQLPYFRDHFFIFSLWAIFLIISLERKGLYSTDRNLTIPKEIFRVIISVVYTGMLISAIIFFAQYKFFSRQVFLISFFMLCMFLSAWRVVKRLIVRLLISKGFHNINVLIVGAQGVGKVVLEEIRKVPWWGLRPAGFLDDYLQGPLYNLDVLGKINDFSVIAHKYLIDEVIVTVPIEKKNISELINQAKRMRLGVRIVPNNLEEPLPVLDISHLGVIPLLTYKERRHHPAEFALKRLFDFIFSLMALMIFSPLFLIISVLIKSGSKGSIFYIQKRTGLKRKEFNFYKFRSMVDGAENLRKCLTGKNEVKDGVIFKIKNDPRITPVGRFLRKYSLDELPQLFNVLKGDMSLVGPRPPLADEVEKYSHIHMQRLSIRPGMTGLSQVRGRSELTFRKWVKWDLWYVNNWSFGLDLMILWWTFPTVLRGKGAY
ncbi:MAG: sugar transferase [Candidatus Omnitrophota bacterium]